MISLPTPENNFNVVNPEGSVVVINNFTCRRVPGDPARPTAKEGAKPGTWNVSALIDVYFNQEALDKSKAAITTKEVTINFTSPPTLDTLEKEVIANIEGAKSFTPKPAAPVEQ